MQRLFGVPRALVCFEVVVVGTDRYVTPVRGVPSRNFPLLRFHLVTVSPVHCCCTEPVAIPPQAIPAITSTFGYPILLVPLMFIVIIDMIFTIIEVITSYISLWSCFFFLFCLCGAIPGCGSLVVIQCVISLF